MQKYWKNQGILSVWKSGNHVRVNYHYHEERIRALSVYTGCGGNLTATDSIQKLAHEGYPDRYANNRRCEYRISVPDPLQPVIITFDQFRTEGCCDCLYVYDGGYH